MHVLPLTYGQANWPLHASTALHKQSRTLPWRDWLRVANKLRSAGMSKVGVLQPIAQLASLELRPNEHIKSLACGDGHVGKVTMLATNQRLVIAEQSHGTVLARTLIYPFIDGAIVSQGLRSTHLTVLTHFGDYRIRNINPQQAERFAHYIERRCEPSHHKKEAWYDHNPQKRPV